MTEAVANQPHRRLGPAEEIAMLADTDRAARSSSGVAPNCAPHCETVKHLTEPAGQV